MLVAAAAIVSVSGGRGNPGNAAALIADDSPELTSLDAPANLESDRPVYRHSVIPGGAYTPEELRTALVKDPVAATHYEGLNRNAVRQEIVKRDRFAYVSYRKNDQIYWTRNKVRLAAGETILTDGTQEVRARCGNCISETPMSPVAETEPDLIELDRLVDDDEPGGPDEPLLSAARRSASP
mgnify:CR=1 FL=1